MSEAPSDPTPSGPKETAWDSASEKELDEVLSNAAALAADLSGQLAAPDEAVARGGQNPLDADQETLDGELAQLGDLVAATANEVSEGAAGTQPTPVDGEQPVPDFMAEFMSPKPPAPAPGSTPATADLHLAADDAAGSAAAAAQRAGLAGIVGNPINIVIPSSAPGRARDSVGSGEAATDSEQQAAVEGGPLGAFAPIVAILDLVDRPFAWAGGGIRKIIGLIAVLVLVASAVVWFWGSR